MPTSMVSKGDTFRSRRTLHRRLTPHVSASSNATVAAAHFAAHRTRPRRVRFMKESSRTPGTGCPRRGRPGRRRSQYSGLAVQDVCPSRRGRAEPPRGRWPCRRARPRGSDRGQRTTAPHPSADRRSKPAIGACTIQPMRPTRATRREPWPWSAIVQVRTRRECTRRPPEHRIHRSPSTEERGGGPGDPLPRNTATLRTPRAGR